MRDQRLKSENSENRKLNSSNNLTWKSPRCQMN